MVVVAVTQGKYANYPRAQLECIAGQVERERGGYPSHTQFCIILNIKNFYMELINLKEEGFG